LPALLLVLHRSGALQNLNVEALATLFEEAAGLDQEAQKQLMQDPKVVEAALLVEAKLINKLPRVPVSGRLNAADLEVECIDNEVSEPIDEPNTGTVAA
jgi:hypothetical protein